MEEVSLPYALEKEKCMRCLSSFLPPLPVSLLEILKPGVTTRIFYRAKGIAIICSFYAVGIITPILPREKWRGRKRERGSDLLEATQVLYQLSELALHLGSLALDA